MLSKAEKIELLENFMARNNFSEHGWSTRGVAPSGSFISESLHTGFKQTAGELIDAVNQNASGSAMKRILVSAMRDCKKLDLDTEEKEYSADLFFELSEIVGVNLKHRLNLFIYGYFLIGLIYLVRLFRGERKFRVIRQNCENCNAAIAFHLEERSIQESSAWEICQCASCNNYFLNKYDLSAKELKYENCGPVEYLPKDEFNYEQAEIRLEQIKYFRK